MVEVDLGGRSEVPWLGPVVANRVTVVAHGLDACFAVLGCGLGRHGVGRIYGGHRGRGRDGGDEQEAQPVDELHCGAWSSCGGVFGRGR